MSPADRLPPLPPSSSGPQEPYLNPRGAEPELEADAEPPFATMPDVTERELQADTLAFEQIGRRTPRNWGWLKLVVALAVVGGGGYYAWHKWGQDLVRSSSDEIPTIHAVEGPYKFRPETPGGAEIPNRDKDVYALMEKGKGAAAPKGAAKSETLKPRPEAPLPPPMPAAPPSRAGAEMSGEGSPQMSIMPGEDDDDMEMTEVAPETPAPPPAATPAPQASVTIPAQPPRTPTAALPTPEQVRAAAKPPAAPTPPSVKAADDQLAAIPAPTTPISAKAFKIQLGAVRSDALARAEWDKLRKGNMPVLGRLTLHVEKADLGVKGIYYRIQAGPFADRAAADAACQELTKQKTPCLAIRPEG